MSNEPLQGSGSATSYGSATLTLEAPSEAHFVKLIGLGIAASAFDFALTWVPMSTWAHALSVLPTFLLPIQLRRMQGQAGTSPRLRNATQDSARRARLRGLLWAISRRLS